MLAYTAWDSLRTIAREVDADLTIVAGDRLVLAPHRECSFAPVSLHRLAERALAGLALFAVTF